MEKATIQAIKDLSANGWTRSKIADVLGVTLSQIREVLGKTNRGRKSKDEKSKKDVTIIDVISIDQSGSMVYVAEETANGVNEYLNDMATKAKETGIPSFAGVTTFDSGWRRQRANVEVDIPITDVTKITTRFDSQAGGGTPLNDGIAESINLAEEFIKKNKIKNADVTITVFTDGGENSSKITVGQTRTLVKKVKANGWTVAFVGPKGSKAYADNLKVDNVLEYDPRKKENFTKSYKKMSAARSAKSDDIALGKFSNTAYFVEQ